MIKNLIIPEMTHLLSSAWDQPDASEIDLGIDGQK